MRASRRSRPPGQGWNGSWWRCGTGSTSSIRRGPEQSTLAESASEERSETPAILTGIHAEDTSLPATLHAGREVFFFTGEERRSSAEATARSLHELGAREIRTYCFRKGRGEGPDPFPPGSLVVVDIRWLGHSQSGPILDRAERNGVDHLAVRSGKGNLARAVAAGLPRWKEGEALRRSA